MHYTSQNLRGLSNHQDGFSCERSKRRGRGAAAALRGRVVARLAPSRAVEMVGG